MRLISLATVSALALTASVAFAQTSPPAGGVPTPPSGMGIGSPAVAPPRPVANPLTGADVSQIKGTNVYGSDDKKIGAISTELMDPGSKRIDRLVIAAGGMLGVGTHYVALPLDQFRWDSSKGAFTIASTADDLKAMPEWQDASNMPSGDISSGSSVPPAAPPR
jgi:hypothetical protein